MPAHAATYDQQTMTATQSTFGLICPVCGGRVEKIGESASRSSFACTECACDVIVPNGAWDVARTKREQKWLVKRTAFSPLRRLFGGEGTSVASGPGTRVK